MIKKEVLLDAVRGGAAQFVVLGHAYSIIFGPSLVNSILGWASYSAVLVFFLLSGYVIVGSLLREVKRTGTIDFTDFAIRRIARIMPPFLFTICLVFWMFHYTEVGRSLSGSYEVSALSAVRSFIFAFTSHDAIVLTPVWSLRLEVGLYIFAALGAAVYMSDGLVRFLLAAIFVAMMALFVWKLSFAVTAITTFGAGALLALRGVSPPSKWNAPVLTKLTARTGDYSYTIYLAHMPVIYMVSSAIENKPAAFVLSLIAANLLAYCAALIFERSSYFTSVLRRLRPTTAMQTS